MFSQASVSHSVHNQPHGCSVTAHPRFGAVGTHPTGMLSCYRLYILQWTSVKKHLQTKEI